MLKLQIVTPERLLLEETIQQITLPTATGEITILPDHQPLISLIKAGVIDIVKTDGAHGIIAISSGFVEVSDNTVIILADTAEHAAELNEEKIVIAKTKAEKMKAENQYKDESEFTEQNALLEKELARDKAKNKWKKIKNIK